MSSKLFKNFIKKAILERQPGPPPREGLRWKPQTHRWIRPKEQEDMSADEAGFRGALSEIGGEDEAGAMGAWGELKTPDDNDIWSYEDFLSDSQDAGLREKIPGFLTDYKSNWEARDPSVRPEWGSGEWMDEVGDVTFDIGFAMPEGGDDEDEHLNLAENWIQDKIRNSGVEGFENFGNS